MYEKYAMGSDELRPLTLQSKTTFGGIGATLIDSLDTLWMMGLMEEFDRCIINADLSCRHPKRGACISTLSVTMQG